MIPMLFSVFNGLSNERIAQNYKKKALKQSKPEVIRRILSFIPPLVLQPIIVGRLSVNFERRIDFFLHKIMLI